MAIILLHTFVVYVVVTASVTGAPIRILFFIVVLVSKFLGHFKRITMWRFFLPLRRESLRVCHSPY